MKRPDSPASTVSSVIVLLLLPIALVLTCSTALAMVLLRAGQRRLNACYTGFARTGIVLGRTRLEVHGDNAVDSTRSYVVVSNHESNWDPVCIVAALPRLRIRFVAKREIMRIPIFGHALRATGNVTVERRRDPGDVQRIRSTMDARDPEVSMLFFAEGTRSRDGSLRPFKMGAFATAIEEGLPILPVAVAGTRRVWPPGSVWVRSGPAVVEVGDAIETRGRTGDQRAALRDEVHGIVAALRRRARGRLRDIGVEPGGID